MSSSPVSSVAGISTEQVYGRYPLFLFGIHFSSHHCLVVFQICFLQQIAAGPAGILADAVLQQQGVGSLVHLQATLKGEG